MDKIVTVNGKEIGLRLSALTPRIYRHKLGRDLLIDIAFMKRGGQREDGVAPQDIIENLMWVAAKQYDKDAVPDSPEEWLDSLQMDEVRVIRSATMELWALNNKTTAVAKKK